jgi:hypothetical protein
MIKFPSDISFELYYKMRKTEEEFRLSELFQSMYQSVQTDGSIERLVQEATLAKYGYTFTPDDLKLYQETIYRFNRNDFDVFWIQNNIHRYPDFAVGDTFNPPVLYDENEREIHFDETSKVCILASSDS